MSTRTTGSVHLASPFVKHFHTRTDDALPIVAAIATLPIVLADGTVVAGRGLDRDRGISLRIPPALLAMLPTREQSDANAVYEAFRFLADERLCDVATDFIGKVYSDRGRIDDFDREVTQLPERPVFFVTAGRRGGGKTTVLIMLLMAVTGIRPAAAAWSSNEEERRKGLLAYLMEALPAIIWDNIVRKYRTLAARTSSGHARPPSMLTGALVCRKWLLSPLLSFSSSPATTSAQVAISPAAACGLWLELDRAGSGEPPVRATTDPIGWTEANRGRILAALYTILLGNPNLRPGSNAAPQTRFKTWWLVFGSAIEFAAKVHLSETAERVAALAAGCGPQVQARADQLASATCSSCKKKTTRNPPASPMRSPRSPLSNGRSRTTRRRKRAHSMRQVWRAYLTINRNTGLTPTRSEPPRSGSFCFRNCRRTKSSQQRQWARG